MAAARKPDPTQMYTAGAPIRMQKPKSKRTQKSTTVEIVQEINPAHGFVKFLREQAVVGLAVGFIIGAQAQVLVRQLVDSFVNPIFTLFFGEELKKRTFVLSFDGNDVDFGWGAFVYALVNFLFVIFAIYLFIRIFRLDKLDKPKEKKTVVHKIIP